MLLHVENIKKDYLMGKKVISVLKGATLAVDRGEIIAIMGKSGAGKSTLLNIIGTLDRPDSGDIFFEEQPLFKYNDRQLAEFRNKNIGFVFQFHYLLPEFDALENVMMPGLINSSDDKKLREQAEEILVRVGLADRLHHRSNELSGGEQQRVAFARALINQPKLILADEPSGNLDIHSSEILHEMMWSFSKEFNTAFIVVTHDRTLAEKADKIINMVDGVI